MWFTQPKNYSENLQEDQQIRIVSRIMYKKNMKISSSVEGIACMQIQKRIDLIEVIIYMGFPKLLIEPRRIEELQMSLKKLIV